MLKVFQVEQERENRVTHLALEEVGDGSIDLIVVTEDGDEVPRGGLLNISPLGVIRHPGIGGELGLLVDAQGRVKEREAFVRGESLQRGSSQRGEV